MNLYGLTHCCGREIHCQTCKQNVIISNVVSKNIFKHFFWDIENRINHKLVMRASKILVRASRNFAVLARRASLKRNLTSSPGLTSSWGIIRAINGHFNTKYIAGGANSASCLFAEPGGAIRHFVYKLLTSKIWQLWSTDDRKCYALSSNL